MRNLLLWLLILLPGLGATEPLRVFVGVRPQKALVEKVGGKHVEVHPMVQPGHNPHTSDPTPQQITALNEAELYVRSGVPFELAWTERIRSANAHMQILDARAGMELRDIGDNNRDTEHPGDHETKGGQSGQTVEARLENQHHEAGESDPHVWTSPALVKHMAGRIPDKVKVIFVQPQFSKKSAEEVARAIGGRVVAIDPLAADFANNLRKVARQIAEAARE